MKTLLLLFAALIARADDLPSPEEQIYAGSIHHDLAKIQDGLARGANLVNQGIYRVNSNTELRSDEGSDALSFAASQNFPEGVQLLAAHGLSARTLRAQIAAGLSGSVEMLALLERLGMPLEIRTDWTAPYMTPKKYFFPTCSPVLLEAARGGHADLVRALLDRGLNPNARCLYLTPMLEASEPQLFTLNPEQTRNAEETVRVLLEHGGDPNARGEKLGETLLEKIPGWASPDFLRYLFRHGAVLTHNSEILQQDIFNDVILDLEKLKAFVEDGHADVHQKSSNGDNLLLASICWGMDYPSQRFAIWEYLISKGASVTEKDSHGHTLLRTAIEWQFTPSAIKRLRELGAQ